MPLPLLLAPLLAKLAENGLEMVGNAIMAKGKEVVEEKLGVKIPDNPEKLTPELIQELQIRKMEHEEFLIDAGIRQRDQEIQEYAIQVDDTKSARDRDAAMMAAGYRNSRANSMLGAAGLGVVVILFTVVYMSPMDDFEKSILTLILGRALGYIDQGFNFEFGTTRSSGKKDDIISNLSNGGGK
jgi:hypothetical protein